MIAFLMGVPSKLKTLTDRLTSTRATNLDNLDATVSTRAAASTALSTATWTSGRAAKLDDVVLTTHPTVKIPKASGVDVGLTEMYTNTDTIRQSSGTGSSGSSGWATIHSYTGSGILKMCCCVPTGTAATYGLRITIDGVVVGTGTHSATGGGTPQSVIYAVGSIFGDGRWAPHPIPFNTSLLIETYCSTTQFRDAFWSYDAMS